MIEEGNQILVLKCVEVAEKISFDVGEYVIEEGTRKKTQSQGIKMMTRTR